MSGDECLAQDSHEGRAIGFAVFHFEVGEESCQVLGGAAYVDVAMLATNLEETLTDVALFVAVV